jgi:Nitrile hydratase, alpha chain
VRLLAQRTTIPISGDHRRCHARQRVFGTARAMLQRSCEAKESKVSSHETVKGHELLGRVVARARTDDHYRQRLLADPKLVLREEGLEVADDVEVVVHENQPDRVHLVLPRGQEGSEGLDVNTVQIDPLMNTLHF